MSLTAGRGWLAAVMISGGAAVCRVPDWSVATGAIWRGEGPRVVALGCRDKGGACLEGAARAAVAGGSVVQVVCGSW